MLLGGREPGVVTLVEADYLALRDWLRGHDDDRRLYERVQRGVAILARAKGLAGPEGHV